MADNRKILHGIRPSIPKDAEPKDRRPQVFKAGMEDELAATLSQEELDAAVKRGDLSGDWKALKSVPKKESEFSNMTVAELKTAAADRGIEGAEGMKKAELVEALEQE